jgi:hypothetical protein
VVADDEAAMMGVILPPQDRSYRVWRENWPSLELFLACSTQWRTGPNGVVGLDYLAVQTVMGWMGIEGGPSLFQDLRVMEGEALKNFHGRD